MLFHKDSYSLLARSLYVGCQLKITSIVNVKERTVESPVDVAAQKDFFDSDFHELIKVLRYLEETSENDSEIAKIEIKPQISWLALKLEDSWISKPVIILGPFCPPSLASKRNTRYTSETHIQAIGHLMLAALHGLEARFPLIPTDIFLWKLQLKDEPKTKLKLHPISNFDKISSEDNLKITNCIIQGDVERLKMLLRSGITLLPSSTKDEVSYSFYKTHYITSCGTCCQIALEAGINYIQIKEISDRYLAAIEDIPNINLIGRLSYQMLMEFTQLISESKHLGYSNSVRKMMRYMKVNLNHQITLSTLAAEVGINPNYASVLFKKETKKTFRENLHEQRIMEAKKLLMNSKISIKEIAFSVGFTLPNHFAKVFKTVTGKSPKEYRASISEI